jgi:Family of unknown function (DUF6982)
VVLSRDGKSLPGYLDPGQLSQPDTVALLSTEGEQLSVALAEVKSIFFVREFTENFIPERKAFFSRPKIQGLWVRLEFTDGECLEGIVPNNLLSLLDHGVQITPPDLHGNSLRIFIPRSALRGLTVLGVVGGPRRPKPAKAPAAPQQKLFEE